eukprot:351469-Chlamydomonas_euryale.AAC.8
MQLRLGALGARVHGLKVEPPYLLQTGLGRTRLWARATPPLVWGAYRCQKRPAAGSGDAAGPAAAGLPCQAAAPPDRAAARSQRRAGDA